MASFSASGYLRWRRRAYQQLLEHSVARNRADIARLVGVTRSRISQRMQLLELDPVTQQKLTEHSDLLIECHGPLLCGVKDLPTRHGWRTRRSRSDGPGEG